MIPLKLDYLRNILAKDFSRLKSFWPLVAYRIITINEDKLGEFKMLTQDRLKQFCKMCSVKLYKPGSVVNIKNGGVVLRGCL